MKETEEATVNETEEATVNEAEEIIVKKTADRVLAIAMAEEGYLEKSRQAYVKNHKILDSKEDGAGSENYTKYGRDMHALYPKVMDFAQSWCDCFVDWCFYQAFGEEDAKALLGGRFDDYTRNSAKLYQNMKAWHTDNPKVGDQIFFMNKEGKICHTGLVYKVADGKVYTIEGNTSSADGVVANGGCVRKKEYSVRYQRIAGYGRPKYDPNPMTEEEIEEAKEKEWKDLVAELQKALNAEFDANLVVDGEAGKKTLMATPTLSVRLRNTRPKTVKAFQNLLTYWGYSCYPDGDFFNATEKQVRLFQNDNVGKTYADGVFNAQTKSWKVLLKIQ